MMMLYRIFLILLPVFVCSGCKMLNDLSPKAIAPAIGGVIGNLVSEGDPAWTGAGVIGGIMATDIMLNQIEEDEQTAFEHGYYQARSDAIKEFYWMQQNLENSSRGGMDEGRKVYYTIPGPTQSDDGRIFVPHSVTVPIIE